MLTFEIFREASWERSRTDTVQQVGARFARDGVNDIEMRLWVAYGLIALMLAAAVAGIAYFRHNRHDQKYLRQRQREDRKSRDREEAAKRSDAVN